MNDKKYNGWTNYETWLVSLWMDNEEPSYRYWRERADEAFEAEADEDDTFTRVERATLALAKELESEIKDNAPTPESGLYADMLNAALSEVNWYEIAAHWVEEARESLAS